MALLIDKTTRVHRKEELARGRASPAAPGGCPSELSRQLYDFYFDNVTLGF